VSEPPAETIRDAGHGCTVQRGPGTTGSLTASEELSASMGTHRERAASPRLRPQITLCGQLVAWVRGAPAPRASREAMAWDRGAPAPRASRGATASLLAHLGH